MIYLDYNATTPLCDVARERMLPLLGERFGNPSSIHALGRSARAAVDHARDRLAALIGAQPHEIIFTSGGTEANNLALLGLARSQAARRRHLVSAWTEHHAVLNALDYLEQRERFEVTLLDVGQDGLIDVQRLADSIRADTALVSLMQANNETGVVQPLQEISAVCRDRGVLLHSDMVQSFGKLPSAQTNERKELSAPQGYVSLVDAASFAAHKFYGPKGAGFLFLRGGIPLQPMHFGGAHENQRRPGTENVAAIAGMAAAAQFALQDCPAEQARQRGLTEELWRGISARVPSAARNAGGAGLPNTLNISFPRLDSETMLIALDLEGLCASSGSACMVGSVVPSHVLLAMGLPRERARSAIRFSLGKFTTVDEIAAAAEIIGDIMERSDARDSFQRQGAVAV